MKIAQMLSFSVVVSCVCACGAPVARGVETGESHKCDIMSPDASTPDAHIELPDASISDAGPRQVLVCEPDQIPFNNTQTGEIGCMDRHMPDAGPTTQVNVKVESITVAGPSEAQALEVNPGDEVEVAKFKLTEISGTASAMIQEMWIKPVGNANTIPFTLDYHTPDQPPHRFLKAVNNQGIVVGYAMERNGGWMRLQLFTPQFQTNPLDGYTVPAGQAETITLRGTIADGAQGATQSFVIGQRFSVNDRGNGATGELTVVGDIPLGDDDVGSNWIRIVPAAVESPDAGSFGLTISALPDEGSSSVKVGSQRDVNAQTLQLTTEDHGREIQRIGFLIKDESGQWLQAGDVPVDSLYVAMFMNGNFSVIHEIDGRSNFLYGDGSQCVTSWGMISGNCEGFSEPQYLSSTFNVVIPARSQAVIRANMNLGYGACARNGYTLHVTGITTRDVVTGEVHTQSFVPGSFSGSPITVQSNLTTIPECINGASGFFSLGLDQENSPQNGTYFKIGSCRVNFNADATLDEDCADNNATLNAAQSYLLHDQLTALTGLSDPNFGPLTVQRQTAGIKVVAQRPVINAAPHINFENTVSPLPTVFHVICQ